MKRGGLASGARGREAGQIKQQPISHQRSWIDGQGERERRVKRVFLIRASVGDVSR